MGLEKSQGLECLFTVIRFFYWRCVFMTYDEARKFIKSFEKFGIVLGLENMHVIMNNLENIQNKLNIIHIAGTNGKGSVGAFISSVLRASGFKTGRYVSPAVCEYLEKFQINDNIITEKKFCELCQVVKNAVLSVPDKEKFCPTAFEIETAIAFLFFYREKCDFVLLETGMGGRLDATNVISKNICAVITSVSFDHMAFLGNTIEKIAEEKCGIIKNNCPVVFIEQNDNVNTIIKNNCVEKNSSFNMILKKDIQYVGFDGECQQFSYKNYNNLKLRLLGKFQTENASLAVGVLELLINMGYSIKKEDIYNGLFDAFWQGRFQIIRRNPTFIVDGAHNIDAVKQLIEALKMYFPNKKMIFIVGIFKDKDYKNIAETASVLAKKIYTVGLEKPRGLDALSLAEEFLRYNKNTEKTESVLDAVNRAISFASKNDIIIAFGSLSYIGRVIEFVRGKGENL